MSIKYVLYFFHDVLFFRFCKVRKARNCDNTAIEAEVSNSNYTRCVETNLNVSNFTTVLWAIKSSTEEATRSLKEELIGEFMMELRPCDACALRR